MSKVHDFKESLNKSQNANFDEYWEQVYSEAFHGIDAMAKTKDEHSENQKKGIDRIILLKSGRVLKIDEKIRFNDYPDIALEYVSNSTYGTDGWIEKDLEIDYLAYGFYPSKKAYLFDFLMLQRAWRYYGKSWKDKYPKVVAKNKGYDTYCTAVPIDVLMTTVSNASKIDLNKIK